MVLLSRLAVDTSIVLADVYMLVLGLGLGFTMQVLVLAVQNAVDYQHLGVATSSATLFRSMGGTIGVPIFGAIFANKLAPSLPAGCPPTSRRSCPHDSARPSSTGCPRQSATPTSPRTRPRSGRCS
jgi:hypothetical protein